MCVFFSLGLRSARRCSRDRLYNSVRRVVCGHCSTGRHRFFVDRTWKLLGTRGRDISISTVVPALDTASERALIYIGLRLWNFVEARQSCPNTTCAVLSRLRPRASIQPVGFGCFDVDARCAAPRTLSLPPHETCWINSWGAACYMGIWWYFIAGERRRKLTLRRPLMLHFACSTTTNRLRCGAYFLWPVGYSSKRAGVMFFYSGQLLSK